MIAACQTEATTVYGDAATSIQTDEVVKEGPCRPILIQRCVAGNCGHSCSDDVQAEVPPKHLIHSFSCTQDATSCSVTFTTCNPKTGDDDPPPPPVSFDCANDLCPPAAPPSSCVASSCDDDCDAAARSQVPSGWKVIADSCETATEEVCNSMITACDPSTGQQVQISSPLSCPQPCGPTTTQVPCATDCGHDCAAGALAQIGPGERVVGSGCISGPSGQTITQCDALLETCDANGNRHDYSSQFNDPCCGSEDPCCGSEDPCCGSEDPCCGDPCCGDPCCGDECCGDPCCGDPCCGDECCGDPCCGNGGGGNGGPICEDDLAGQPAANARTDRPQLGRPVLGGLRPGAPGAAMRRSPGQPFRDGPASSLRNASAGR